MKFIITESKLDYLTFKFLDDKKFIIRKDINDEPYFLENENDDIKIIRTKKVWSPVNKNQVVCVANYKLIQELMRYFPIDIEKSKEIIKDYVKSVLGVGVTTTWVDWSDTY